MATTKPTEFVPAGATPAQNEPVSTESTLDEAEPSQSELPATEPIEAEADDYTNADSTLEPIRANSTSSLTDSIFAYRNENGRTYHAYRDGSYLIPNDEIENDRLDLQHHLATLTLGGKLLLAPIPKSQTLHRVLDVGTGTGIWAIDFADDHPESQVLGNDLSPIQPGFVSPNLRFEVDDIESPWTYEHKFDLIHSGASKQHLSVRLSQKLATFFSQAYENLNPGGWIELWDMDFHLRCDDGSISPESPYKRWMEYIVEGMNRIGRDVRCAQKYKSQMEAVGFENVTEVLLKWPTNSWPTDRHFKELGMWQLENYAGPGALESFSLAIFTRVLGWSIEEMTVFLATIRNEMKDTRVHTYLYMIVVYAQKPKAAATA